MLSFTSVTGEIERKSSAFHRVHIPNRQQFLGGFPECFRYSSKFKNLASWERFFFIITITIRNVQGFFLKDLMGSSKLITVLGSSGLHSMLGHSISIEHPTGDRNKKKLTTPYVTVQKELQVFRCFSSTLS